MNLRYDDAAVFFEQGPPHGDRALTKVLRAMLAQLASRSVATSSGRAISYLCAGVGQSVVFLHGIGSSAASWRRQLELAPDGLELIAWNAPGYGASDPLPDDSPEPDDYADALLAFVDALRLERFHLVGHSLGALIAARFAVRWPHKLASLTLASIAAGHAHLSEAERLKLKRARLDIFERAGYAGMAQARGPALLSENASDEMKREVIDNMANLKSPGWLQAVEMLSKGDTQSDVAAIPEFAPLQFVFGSRDGITTPQVNRRIAAERPDAPVFEIEGAGHAVYIEKAQAFNDVLFSFLTAHR